jgi:hypothetical protein
VYQSFRFGSVLTQFTWGTNQRFLKKFLISQTAGTEHQIQYRYLEIVLCCYCRGARVGQSCNVWLRTGRPGFDPRQRQRIFPLASVSRPALGPTQPPVQWVPGVLSPVVKRGRDVMLTTHPHLVPRLKMSRSYPPLTPSASMACSGITLPFYYCHIDYRNDISNFSALFISFETINACQQWTESGIYHSKVRTQKVCASYYTLQYAFPLWIFTKVEKMYYICSHFRN